MPSRAEFAAALKAKHPEYQGVPDDDLVTAILQKYPQFKDQVDSYDGTPGYADAATRALARASGGLVPPQKVTDELGNEVGGGPKILENFVRNPGLQGAAHPTGLGDIVSLLLPSSLTGVGELSAGNLARGAKSALKAGTKAAGNPALHPIDFIRGAVQDIKAPGKMAEGYSRWMPNTSPSHFYTDADALYHNPEIDLGEKTIIDRYMPNVSTSEAPAAAVAHDRIPYGASPVQPSASFLRRKAPSVSMSDAEYDKLLSRLGGKGKPPSLLPGDSVPSMDATDWHSGAEPGSAEAASATKLHRATGEMDSAFKAKMDDPLASLLITALLGGGSAGALMSSRGAE